jgi:hypothetical protein
MCDQTTSNREAELPAPTRIGSSDWLGHDLPQEYYHGNPGEYLCHCITCNQRFLGDKRDCTCPKCRNGGRIASAYRDAEGWVLFDTSENVIEKWPDDWPQTVDVKFLEHRGIKIA